MHRPVALIATALLAAGPAQADPRPPIPDAAFDGGVFSAESLGRGGTIASNRATPASGSENPASLDQPSESGSVYVTTLVDTRSDIDEELVHAVDPLHGKVLQYLAVAADKGVLFYEPVSRLRETQVVDSSAGTFRDVELNANAIGFAGASRFRAGSIGISMAYLWSNLNVTERDGASILSTENDTSDGVRLNIGVRYPTGPAMWGLLVQNAPGFLWGGDYRRSQLPIRVRAGNTYRLAKGVLLSVEAERRFYNEGGRSDDFFYVGNESFVGKTLVLRAGAFGTSLNKSEDRRLTAGLSILAGSGTTISYAIEAFEVAEDKVKRSIVSVQIPFVTESE